MATISRTAKAGGGTNFNTGQTIDPAEVNTDFNTIVTEINGALDDGNIETATIPGAKSLRFTEISAPSSPSSNDVLAYVLDPDTLVLKQSSGYTLSLPVGDATISELGSVIRRQSSDTTERTCTNSATDLSSHTVNIPAGDAFIVCGLVRKTSGAGATASLGIKVNAVQIINNFAVTTANNQVEFGFFSFGLSYGVVPGAGIAAAATLGAGRDTNYTQGPTLAAVTGTSGGTLVPYQAAAFTAQLPTAAITAIIVTGLTGSASVTLGIKNVTVYRVVR